MRYQTLSSAVHIVLLSLLAMLFKILFFVWISNSCPLLVLDGWANSFDVLHSYKIPLCIALSYISIDSLFASVDSFSFHLCDSSLGGPFSPLLANYHMFLFCFLFFKLFSRISLISSCSSLSFNKFSLSALMLSKFSLMFYILPIISNDMSHSLLLPSSSHIPSSITRGSSIVLRIMTFHQLLGFVV